MWKKAIEAIQDNHADWINSNHPAFRNFFREENTLEKGKLNDTALQEHYKAKLFKMFIETSLNGLELDLRTGAKWIENASRLDGNWGWLLAIGVGGAYFTHYLDEDVREHYFKPDNALVAGSGKPSGEAVSLGELWRVNGSWDYCSGSEQASLFTAVTHRKEGISALVLPKEKIRIERNWNAIGLALTCSHTIIAEDIEVPEDHFFDLSRTPAYSQYPISSYPFDLFARVCFVPVIMGISKSLWLEIGKIIDNKLKIWQQYQPEKNHAIQRIRSDFEKNLDRLTTVFYDMIDNSWKGHLNKRDVQMRSLQKSSLELSSFCYKMSSEMIPLLGMEVMKKDHPVQICWQDLQTAYQHMVFRDY